MHFDISVFFAVGSTNRHEKWNAVNVLCSTVKYYTSALSFVVHYNTIWYDRWFAPKKKL